MATIKNSLNSFLSFLWNEIKEIRDENPQRFNAMIIMAFGAFSAKFGILSQTVGALIFMVGLVWFAAAVGYGPQMKAFAAKVFTVVGKWLTSILFGKKGADTALVTWSMILLLVGVLSHNTSMLVFSPILFIVGVMVAFKTRVK